MPLLALAVRQPAEREQIGTLEQPHAVVERQPLAGVELRRDIRDARADSRNRWLACTLCVTTAQAHAHSERLYADGAGARSIELGDEDALPLAEHQLAAADLQRQAVAEQHGAQVRVGVHAIAVRVLRVVVHPLGVAIDHLLEEPLDVRVQRLLRLVDEERARRVHRPQADHPLPHAALADEVHDRIGDVDELDAPVGLHEHGIGMDDEGPRHGCGLHWRVPDGQTRALGHQLAIVPARGFGTAVAAFRLKAEATRTGFRGFRLQPEG